MASKKITREVTRPAPEKGKKRKIEESTGKTSDSVALVKSLKTNETSFLWEKPFPVNGQGTFIFNVDSSNEQILFISVEDKDGNNSLALYIDQDKAYFLQDFNSNIVVLATASNGSGIEKGKIAYWYSYDRDNLVLKYGKGYRMEETTLLVYDFLKGVKPEDQEKVREDMEPYFNPVGKKYVRQYQWGPRTTALSGGISVTEEKIQFDKNPFICNLPPLILDSSKTNLFLLDQGEYVFSASLPAACRELYENVRHCDLDYPEEVDSVLLSDSIRYSIKTEGCVLNEKLKEKSSEFGSDPNESYLRVTLGQSLGKSPGIPYVLEIWPSGHYSPIHNHGNANAVIKVIFGSIHVNVYNKHTRDDDAKPLKSIDLYKGDVTWIDRNWYQTHMLKNITTDYCATIQCYNYDSGDTTHWPYFDYISENDTIEEFLPNSDFTFQSLRSQVMDEYKKYKQNHRC